jgi:hypothetical protein
MPEKQQKTLHSLLGLACSGETSVVVFDHKGSDTFFRSALEAARKLEVPTTILPLDPAFIDALLQRYGVETGPSVSGKRQAPQRQTEGTV